MINPFKKHNYKNLLIKYFWNGKYFFDDLSGKKHVAGDANTLPFWSKIINDKEIFRKALSSVQKEKLDKPFPLKYTFKEVQGETDFASKLVPGYETNAVWIHVGMMFICAVSMFDKQLAKKYLLQYKKIILKHKNFLEVHEPDGKPFSRLIYYTDESMLWCANYLWLKKKLSF